MEVVIEMDLLMKEQAMLVEYFEVDEQLVAEDIVDMFEDTADMAEGTVHMVEDTIDMAENIVGMVEDMVDMIENIAEMVSSVVVDKFAFAKAWEHSKNSEHTSDLVQEVASFGLETYLEVEVLIAMVS